MTTTGRPTYVPSTSDISRAFADEITSLGGTVPDVYDDGERMFARGVLPADAEVRPGDHIRGGVALRVAGPQIQVHPYTFRQVCSNGAIAAQALESRRLERIEAAEVAAPTSDTGVVMIDLRLAVRACAAPEAFAVTTRQMRSATEVEADLALNLLPVLARMPGGMHQRWLSQILRRFSTDEDRSVFGLMNAVTSVARDVRDQDARWRLEELGGTIPARLVLKPKVVARPEPALVGA